MPLNDILVANWKLHQWYIIWCLKKGFQTYNGMFPPSHQHKYYFAFACQKNGKSKLHCNQGWKTIWNTHPFKTLPPLIQCCLSVQVTILRWKFSCHLIYREQDRRKGGRLASPEGSHISKPQRMTKKKVLQKLFLHVQSEVEPFLDRWMKVA